MTSKRMGTSHTTFALIAVSLVASANFSLASIITQLDPFNTISICAPLNILVVPSTDDASMVEIEADQAANVRTSTSSSTLFIETIGSVQADESIKIKVSLPASALHAVNVNSLADVYLAPGFAAKTLSLSASQLGGSIAASQLKAEKLSVFADGLGKVTLEGNFKEANVSASGASSVHIAGLENTATLSLGGSVDVAITATKAGASIVGTSQGSRVLYNQGKCSIRGAQCVREEGLTITAAPMLWTCKAAITGSNLCQSSGRSASTFSSPGSDCPVMTWAGSNIAASRDSSMPTFSRKLRQTSTSSSTQSVSSTSGGGSSTVSGSLSGSGVLPTSYTYTTTSTGSDGQPSITSCSFVNNKGGCQVNGVSVPVQQFNGSFSPAPAPSPVADTVASQVINQISRAAAVAANIGSATASTSAGGTSCVFVNGIGGCDSTG